MGIITDIQALKEPCLEIAVRDGIEIAEDLLSYIKRDKYAVGLAANQLGINKRVCVVDVVEPLIFVNPEIIEATGETIFSEGCLSFPGAAVYTRRYTKIIVRATTFYFKRLFLFLKIC